MTTLRLVLALVLVLVLDVSAHAQSPFDEPEPPPVKWSVDVIGDRGWLGARGVDPDGRHLGLTWSRDRIEGDCVVVFRRPIAPGVDAKPHAVKPVDRPGPGLRPAFIYPSSPREWHSAFDALNHPIPPGSKVGEWTVVASVDGDPEEPIIDELERGKAYEYALVSARHGERPDTYEAFGMGIATGALTAEAAWFYKRRWFHLALIVTIAAALGAFAWRGRKRGRAAYVRRLPGVDALEEAVGRSTEMGRPVLYVSGIGETQDIQTIASLLILGHVAKITADYDTDLRVANAYPLTMVIAEEIVRASYARAGRADAHRPEDVLFISSEQFAFAAGVSGMILREQPATNIFFGKFYAESLLLAETGFLTGAVQIAGTAELTQLPFFIAACDYTLIGEELFATSAYLTRAPDQLALVKAGDVMKVVIVVLVIGFAVCATLSSAGYYPFTRFSIEDVVP